MIFEASNYHNTSSNEKVAAKWWYLLITLGAVTILVWIAVFALTPDYKLHVNFYDVGQGDSIFIETYQGNQILIDGGPDSTVLSKLGRDLPFYDRDLDLMVLTHPHADHVSGLVEVLQRYKVKQVLITGVKYDTQVYKRFHELIQELNIPVTIAYAGQQIYLDDATLLRIVYPRVSLEGQTIQDLNESSIVARLSFGLTDFLLTGDASTLNERQIIASGYTVSAEVLKVGHQGSRTSTDLQFLQTVSPAYAVISVGEDNRYGHPHKEVMERLESAKLILLRTDQDGDVRFESDGTALTRDN